MWHIQIDAILLNLQNTPKKQCKKLIKGKLSGKKNSHPITSQYMGSGQGHSAAPMMDFIKNGSKIKILKIPHILTKFSKYSMLDHIYFSMCIFTVQGLLENGKCREMGFKLKYMISIIQLLSQKNVFLYEVEPFVSLISRMHIYPYSKCIFTIQGVRKNRKCHEMG